MAPGTGLAAARLSAAVLSGTVRRGTRLAGTRLAGTGLAAAVTAAVLACSVTAAPLAARRVARRAACLVTAAVTGRLPRLAWLSRLAELSLGAAVAFPRFPGTDRGEVRKLPLVSRRSVIPLVLGHVAFLTRPTATRSAGE
jgi:hypothetical protein